MLNYFKYYFKNVTATIIVAVMFFGCNKESRESPGPNEIWLEYKLFNPQQLRVSVGTTVTFINKGNPNHQLQGALFQTGVIRTGESHAHTFSAVGTYYFTCGIHPAEPSEQVAVRVE